MCGLVLAVAAASSLQAEPVSKRYYVEESYAIVIGRLTQVAVAKRDSVESGTGVVTVESVVTGPGEVGNRHRLEWSHSPETARMCPPSFDYRQVEGQRGLWFLERAEDGSIRPSGEFWSLENVESLQYYADILQTMDAQSARVVSLTSIIREHLQERRTFSQSRRRARSGAR